jgi:hypothetical protein
MTAGKHNELAPDELGAMIQEIVGRIRATVGDYYDASVYPNDNGVYVSVTDEDSIWTHEWEVTRVPGRPTWEIKYTTSRTGYYANADDLINEITGALPDADESDSPVDDDKHEVKPKAEPARKSKLMVIKTGKPKRAKKG